MVMINLLSFGSAQLAQTTSFHDDAEKPGEIIQAGFDDDDFEVVSHPVDRGIRPLEEKDTVSPLADSKPRFDNDDRVENSNWQEGCDYFETSIQDPDKHHISRSEEATLSSTETNSEDLRGFASFSVSPYSGQLDASRTRRIFPAQEMATEGSNNAEQTAVAGPGRLVCTVKQPQKENDGTQNQFISYLVTTDTDIKSFQSTHMTVRRRYTDFVFLYKTLARQYGQCAVPPLPEKHKMEYVRGDRFGPDFTARRASSLQRFLKRLSMHPVLYRATLFTIFLESNDWNATMNNRPNTGLPASEPAPSVLDSWTDSFLNAFSKPHKADKRFVEVKERCDKLDDDLAVVSRTVSRTARRESELEADYADLAAQMRKLALLEPSIQNELHSFVASADQQSQLWKGLRDHTDNSYLTSLKDMEAYCVSLKSLLKTRDQKQLDFEGLTDYSAKAVSERDNLASNNSAITTHGLTPSAATAFIRQKVEDVRGVDPEASRREKVRKLEIQIRRLQDEVERAKKTSEMFDEEVIKEVADFECIKAAEFSDTLSELADAQLEFFKGSIDVWERFLKDLEKLDAS